MSSRTTGKFVLNIKLLSYLIKMTSIFHEKTIHIYMYKVIECARKSGKY